jgi:hypothetical protein
MARSTTPTPKPSELRFPSTANPARRWPILRIAGEGQLAGRQDLVTARKLAGAREKLREMLEMIDDLQSEQAQAIQRGLYS